MPENEFEKEVQHKMDGFKLRPSDAIWQTVSAKIVQQKRKRRRMLLPLLLLCGFLTGTLILSDVHRDNFFKSKVAVATIAAAKKTNETSGSNNKDTTINRNIKVFEISAGPHDNTVGLANKKPLSSATNKQIKKQPTVLATTKAAPEITFALSNKTRHTTGKKSTSVSAGTAEEMATNSSDATENNLEVSHPKGTGVVLKPVSSDNKIVDTSSVGKKIAAAPQVNADSFAVTKKQDKKGRKNKWNTGIIFSTGQSSTSTGYFGSAASSLYYDYLSSPLGSVNNSSPGTYYSFKVKPAIAFAVGVTFSKSVSSKVNFLMGLNYKLFITSIATGYDSSLNGALRYGAGNTNQYTNYYHFAELPLAVQIQITKIKKLPLYLEAGLSFSRLISTNALQFDISQNKYYIDNSLFHKTIVGLSAGLLINLVNSNKAPLLVGPQFYYSATPVAGSGLYTKAHYSFIGIKLQKMLSKN